MRIVTLQAIRAPSHWQQRDLSGSNTTTARVDVTAELGAAIQELFDRTSRREWQDHSGFRVIRVVRLESPGLWKLYAAQVPIFRSRILIAHTIPRRSRAF